MADAAQPIADEELDQVFADLVPAASGERVAIAVSGGSDSTALMVLLAAWLERRKASPAGFTVLTVDHRLRPEGAAEADAVARLAARLGFAHVTLVWHEPKPRSGLQAAARDARYRAMSEYAHAHAITTLLTAHTADDQAETVLMRLARGSGLDGLGGMAPVTVLTTSPVLRLVRPLLDVPRSRLRASLEARDIAWSEDPSNASSQFERVRLRAIAAELEKAGLTSSMLGLSARRLRRARAALESQVGDFLAPSSGFVRADPCGFFSIDLGRLRGLAPEIALRVLGRIIVAAGGSSEPVPLAALESIVQAILRPDGAGAWTLSRAKLTASQGLLLVEREPGREDLPRLPLTPGSAVLWDGRFRVACQAGIGGPVEVRALGVDGLRQVRQATPVASGRPVGALRALPAFWRGESLLAVPVLDYWSDPQLSGLLSATFIDLGDMPGRD